MTILLTIFKGLQWLWNGLYCQIGKWRGWKGMMWQRCWIAGWMSHSQRDVKEYFGKPYRWNYTASLILIHFGCGSML